MHNKAAELDGSARIWLCTPQQTSTEKFNIFSWKSTVVQCHTNGKVADAPTRATNFHSTCSVINKPEPNSQWPATTMTTGTKVGKTGASVAPGKNHCSGVRVDGAIVPSSNSWNSFVNMCGVRVERANVPTKSRKKRWANVLTDRRKKPKRVRVERANVLPNSLKNQKASSSFNLHQNPQHASGRAISHKLPEAN